jgi:hypothetical protein
VLATDYFKTHGLEFEHLRGVDAEMLECAAAVGTSGFFGHDDFGFTRQMRRKLPPRLGLRGRLQRDVLLKRNCAHMRCLRGFEFLNPQL